MVSRRNFLNDASKRSMVQTSVGNEEVEMDTDGLASIDEIEALISRFVHIKESIVNEDL